MKFLGLWMLCLVIGKDRVLGNAGQCQGQGKCNKPQILNGKASLPPVIETTPASYGNYDYSYDYTHGAAGDGDGPSTYDTGTEMSVTCVDSYWFKGDNKSVGSIRCCDGRWDPGVNEACVAAKCDPTPQFGGALKPSSSCSADGASLTTAVAANSSACLHCLHGFKIRNREGLKDSIEVQCGTDGKWKIPAHCENQIACTRPAASERSNTYSRIKNSNFDAMLQMEFVCTSSDFIMYGSPVVRCLAGKWDVDPLPVCRHKSSCLLAIEHGRITKSPGSANTHGPWARNRDSGTVTCDQGHDSITDDDTLTCNWGKWEPAPHCVEPGLIGKCVTPPLRNGNVILSHKKTIPGTVATHTCASGYTLQGAVNRTCLRDGGWNGKEATCVLQATCDKPQTITHAWDPPDKAYYHNEKYRYICRSGYERRGASQYRCDAYSNRWEPLGFDSRRMRCEPVNCGKPSVIPNADEHLVDGRRTTFGAEVRYQCKTGYEKTRGILVSRICQANGRWTVIGLQCDIVTCPPLTNPSNGKVEIRRGRSNRYEYQSEYKFTCDSSNGYRLKGKQIDDTTLTTCTQYGNWSNPPSKIECELVDCYHPGHIFNGYLQAGNTTYPSQRQFGCNDFTTMEPVFDTARAFIICQRDGRWSESLPKCWGKCRVPNVANGYYQTTWGGSFYSNALEHRNEVKLHCYRDYTTDIRYPSSSTKTLKCDNGTLTRGSCTEKPCDKLSETGENLSNVIYSTDIVDARTSKYYTHGTTADITCRDTHETANRGSTLRLTCNKRRWNKRTPICKPKECIIPTSASFDLRLYTTDWYDAETSYNRGHYLPHGTELSIRCSVSKTVFNSTMNRNPLKTECAFGEWKNKAVFDEICVRDPCSKLNENRLVVDSVHYSKPIVSLRRTDYVHHGTNVSFTCKPRYEVSENKSSGWVKCDTGEYKPGDLQPEVCKAKGCRVPSHADRKYVIGRNSLSYQFDWYFNHDDLVNVTCEDGFVLNSTETNPGKATRCNFGNWKNPRAFGDQCIEAPCGLSEWQEKNGMVVTNTHDTIRIDTKNYVAHGYAIGISCRGTHYLARWTYVQSYGRFEPARTATIIATCTKGIWSPSDSRISCKPRGCTCPQDTDSRSYKCDSTSIQHDATLEVTCKPGYEFDVTGGGVDKLNIDCQFGNFSDIPPCRNASCTLPKPTNGYYTNNIGSKIRHGENATLRCSGDSAVVAVDAGTTGSSTSTGESVCNKGELKPKWSCKKVNKFKCDFEDGLCHWSYDPSGNFTWSRTNGPTSRGAGPSSDHTKSIGGDGFYMYIDTSRRAEKERANLLSPENTETGKRCLRFYYHMSKKDIGRLRVYYIGAQDRIYGADWEKVDGYGDHWWLATVNIEFNYVNERIGIEGMVGSGHNGRIAIDDITLSEGGCPRIACPPIVQRPGIRVTGGNGPDEEVTLECSNGQKQLKITCQQDGRWSVSPTQFGCVDQSSTTTTKVDEGIEAASVPTEAAPTTTSEAAPATTETADTTTLTLAERFSCNFDNDLCKWTHDPSGDFHWIRHQGYLPDGRWRSTGPSSDHTTRNGHYMYMSSSRARGTKVRLKSPELGSRGTKCFEFYYNKYSNETGTNRASTLKLYVGSATSLVFSDSGIYDRSTWIHKRIDVAGYPEEKIIIEGVVGLSRYGDIAIDDVSLSEGKCTTASPASVCRDRFIRACPGWKKSCQDNEGVQRDCKKTCGLCP